MASIESGRKQPTVATPDRLLAAAGVPHGFGGALALTYCTSRLHTCDALGR